MIQTTDIPFVVCLFLFLEVFTSHIKKNHPIKDGFIEID